VVKLVRFRAGLLVLELFRFFCKIALRDDLEACAGELQRRFVSPQQMLDRLIAYLRATLEASRLPAHPLATEYARVADYLALMAIRMGPRRQVELHLPPALAAQIMNKLREWTGTRWLVAISNEPGAPTLKETRDAKEAEKMRGVRAEPLVRSVLERFPGAEIIAVRTIGDVEPVANAYAPQQGGEDVIYADTEIGEDDEDL
jgi:hypothetical protein